jgi:hypothetical protein
MSAPLLSMSLSSEVTTHAQDADDPDFNDFQSSGDLTQTYTGLGIYLYSGSERVPTPDPRPDVAIVLDANITPLPTYSHVPGLALHQSYPSPPSLR